MKKKQPPLLEIVPINDIPNAQDVPYDNLIDVFRVCTQMERVCFDNDGIGLSAVQVGVPWKLFLIRFDNAYRYFLNCEYEGIGDKGKSIEGCLSLRTKDGNLRRFEVNRNSKVKVVGKELVVNEKGLDLVELNGIMDGLYAVVFQHEIDHQNGILISDIGKEIELY